MPFKKVNVEQVISDKRKDPEFNQIYQEVAREYELIRQIVDVRKQHGMTQKQLADKVGVSQQVISRLEREKHIPNLSSFLRILEALDLDVMLVTKKKAFVNEGDGEKYEKY